MVLKIIMYIVVAGITISISGCALKGRSGCGDEKVRTFAENYRRSKEARRIEKEDMMPVAFELSTEIGYVKPYLPVVLPPQVMKVWVPAHVASQDKNVLVSGHWSFVMLEEAGWYIEREIPEGLSIPVIVPSSPGEED